MKDLARKYQAEESLIAKAKAEYTKKTMPGESKTAGGDGKSTASHHSLSRRGTSESIPSLAGFNTREYRRLIILLSVVISDPDNPKFDLEAYLTMKMADEAK